MGGDLIKVAGPPGCGKSTFITTRVKDVLAGGTPPHRIASTSFTRAAAYHNRDLALMKFPEYTAEDFPNFGTLHSIAYKLLGLGRDQVFQVGKFAKAVPVYKFSSAGDAGGDQALDDYYTETAADYSEALLHWKRNCMISSLPEAIRRFKDLNPEIPPFWTIEYLELYLTRRMAYKQEHNLWDFEDMIETCLKNGLHPEIDLFLSDESQDMSPLLMDLAKFWASHATDGSFFVGDAYQAIYGFSGGNPRLLIELEADDSFTLDESHRCSKAVHDAARKLVEKFKNRYADDDFKSTDKTGMVRRAGINTATLNYPGKTFFLFRTRYLLDQQFDRLYRNGIPFVTTRRCRQAPLSGKQRVAAEVLLRLIRGESTTMLAVDYILDRLPSRMGKVVMIKHGTKADIKRRTEGPEGKHPVTKDALQFMGFTPSFYSLFNESDFLELITMEAEVKDYFYKLLRLHGINVFLKAPDLTLSTIHGVKGLEADNVLLSLEMTRMPYENMVRDPDSEGRIMYVGITRARERVELLTPEDVERKYPI